MTVVGQCHGFLGRVVVAHVERLEIGRHYRRRVEIDGRLLLALALIILLRPLLHTFVNTSMFQSLEHYSIVIQTLVSTCSLSLLKPIFITDHCYSLWKLETSDYYSLLFVIKTYLLPFIAVYSTLFIRVYFYSLLRFNHSKCTISCVKPNWMFELATLSQF